MRSLLICALALLCLVSCAQDDTPLEAETTAVPETEAPETTYIKIFAKWEDERVDWFWETDMHDTWEDSTYVIHATVKEIGEAYLSDGGKISPHDGEKAIRLKMKNIRTPVTLTVHEDFKGVLSPEDELILIQFWGEMNGYFMRDYSPPLKIGESYIFFIHTREVPDPATKGQKVNVAWAQLSVRLRSPAELSTLPAGERDFEPLSNPYVYEPYANSAEIITAIRALGEAS